MTVSLKELPDMEVAYIRRIGSYFEPQDHWGRLLDWAIHYELFPPAQSFIGISLDDPDVTEDKDCRHDACVTLPKHFNKEKHREIQFKNLSGGQYAMYSYYDVPEKLHYAFQFMYKEWLPRSDYALDNSRHPLEFNRNNPAEDPNGWCKVDLYVPIKN